jgi:serine/threonine protein kinase
VDPFDLVGDVLDGQFKVEEFVGEGALSVVYRATNEGVSAPVAVKCLNLPQTLDVSFQQSIIDSFVEGCKLHFRLARGHLAIAQTFASGTTVAPRTGAQITYVVREWFEGESLARNLRRRRAEGADGRSLEETIAMFEPIASALTYAHEQDAAHLSLMPSNLFLAKLGDGEETLKLLDFGVGRVVDEAASTRDGKAPPPRMKVLLPSYAAPEQLLGTLGPTGPWTDVYALALVLLEVLSDRPVNGEKDASALVARALSAKERPSPESHGVELPPEVSAILARALALEPESRQTSVAEMWSAIIEIVRPKVDDLRKERRRLATFLRRLRRAKRIDARFAMKQPDATDKISLPPPPTFDEEEAVTAKARNVVAMLAGRAHRASTRPPPPAFPATRPPAPKTGTAIPPRPTFQKRAPQKTLLGLTAPVIPPPAPLPSPSLVVKHPSPIPPPPELMAVLDAVIPPKPPPIPSAMPLAKTPTVAPTRPPTPPPPSPPIISAPPELPSIVVAPEPPPLPPLPPPPLPQPVPAPSAGRVEPHEIPVLASPFVSPRMRFKLPFDRRVAISVGVGTCALLVLIVLVVSLARHPDATARTTPSPASSEPWFSFPVPTQTAPPPPPEPTATAVATASASATTTATAPPKPRGPFNHKQANAAIAAAVKDLGDCSRKHGVWGTGQAGVSFANDGTVRRVYMSAPWNGVEGKCVTKHLEDDVSIDPFNGIIGPVYSRFVVPWTPP